MRTSAKRAEVAENAHVSEATVSRALNDSPLIPDSTKQRVRYIAERLGYFPNKQASSLALKKTFRLGFVVPEYKVFPTFSRSYFPVLLDGVVRGAQVKNYAVTIILDKIREPRKSLSSLVLGKEVDGLLFAINKTADERFENLIKEKIPFVLLNSCNQGCSSIDNNPVPGMRKAFEHLVKFGHRKTGYIAGEPTYSNAMDRLEAFKTLSSEFGVQTMIEQGNFSKTQGYYCAAKLLQGKNPPTVIMTSCDREAIGVLQYCKDHKIAVPDQVSVIGYDDFEASSLITPSLSTVVNPIMEIGKKGAETLVELVENKREKPVYEALDTGFILRESLGKMPDFV